MMISMMRLIQGLINLMSTRATLKTCMHNLVYLGIDHMGDKNKLLPICKWQWHAVAVFRLNLHTLKSASMMLISFWWITLINSSTWRCF